MKKTIYIYFLLSITLLFFSCQEKNIALEQKIDEQLSEFHKADSPGFVVSVSKNDSLLFSKGFGLANVELNKKNTTQTIFKIGSISKSITAACILKLVHSDKIVLSDSIFSYFPELHSQIGNATIKQLLNHTTGIRDNESYGQLVESKGTDPNTGFFIGDDNDHLDLLKIQKTINFSHGSKYLYNNTGYWILGQIVEKVSGKPIEEFAQDELFKPLEMNHSSFGAPKSKDLAVGHHLFNPKEKPSPINITSNSYGDGGVYSSTEDLIKWFNEIVSGKKFGIDFWAEMKTKGLLNDNTETEYGAGLEIKRKNGKVVYSHGGLVPGYFAMGKAYPKDDITICVLTNQTQINAGQIVNLIEDAIFSKIEEPKVVTLTEAESKKYIGKFQQTRGSEIGLTRHIIKKGADFFYHRPGSVDTHIFPIGSNQFIMPFGNQKADITIETDGITNKKILIFKGNDGEPDRIYTEISDNIKPLAPIIDVTKYVGTYLNDETQLAWKIKSFEDKLFIDVITFESPLQWTADNLYTFEGRFSIKFDSINGSDSTSFTLDFGKARNIKFDKLE